MISPDDGRGATDRYTRSKTFIFRPIVGNDFFNLTPVIRSTMIAGKDIGRTGIRAVIIVPNSRDDGRVSADRYTISKVVPLKPITGNEFFDLTPGIRSPLIAGKDVGRAER